jgi:DNA-directed RNA polymerase I, II, and III subunit RPABC2
MSDISDDEVSNYSDDENIKPLSKKKEPNNNAESDEDVSEDDDDDENNEIKKLNDSDSEMDDDDEDGEKNEDDDDDEKNDDDAQLIDESEVVKISNLKKASRTNKKTKLSEIPMNMEELNMSDDEYESSDDEDEDYLKKFDDNIRQNIIADYHPEINQHNYDEIETFCMIVRDDLGNIIDPFHKTIPFLTKYEKTRILGERASQINAGGKPYIEVDPSVIDGYLIALKELEEKKIPYIVRRPLPNGGCEYWKLKDLEILI